MSWERADVHTCADGRLCRGHKVSTRYYEDPNYGTLMEHLCDRCHEKCSVVTITNQNWRDKTGMGNYKPKEEKPKPEWRDSKTGKTLKEMKADSAREIKEAKAKCHN